MFFTNLNILGLLATTFILPSPMSAATLPLDASAAQFITPSPRLPNGVPNPFYPCPARNVFNCPYRCYYTSTTNNLTTTTLIPTCLSASSALIASTMSGAICVKCLPPLDKELAAVDNGNIAVASCQPLRTYFNAPVPDGSGLVSGERPSRCGFKNHRIAACAWNCAAAQTPFTVCDAHNTTGTYRLCAECNPTCSTPRIVFNLAKAAGGKPLIDEAFSLSEGSCAVGTGEGAREQRVACPWRCTDRGADAWAYCSLGNKTADFTSCVKC